ncbi:Cell surface glycoprotein [uncultured archaeon]|nr:Cell surface glycoprotein [uncultured archaeon]
MWTKMRKNILFLNRTAEWLFISKIFGPSVDNEKFPVRVLTAATVLFLILAGSPFVNINNNTVSAVSNPYASDTTPPRSITNLQNITYAQSYINWTWIDPLDSDFSKVMVYLNGTFKTNVTKGIRYYNASSLAPDTVYIIGTHTLDTSGNINQTWVNQTVRTAPISDTNPPIITITSPQNTHYTTTSIPLNVSTNEAISTWLYSLNSAANISFTPNTTIISPQGANNLIVYANDTAGNWNWSAVNFTVDSIAPSSITNLMNASYAQNYINWTWTDPSDPDFSRVLIYLNGVFQTEVSIGVQYYNTTGLTPATTYTLSTRTVDFAGNVNSTGVTYSSTTAPLIIQNLKVSMITNDSASINWTTSDARLGVVKYGTTSGSYLFSQAGGSDFFTSHRVDLKELTSATKYYFIANSTDALGNSEETVEHNFTTAFSFIEETITTIDNKSQAISGSGNTTLNITTNNSVSDAPLNITEHIANPVSNDNIISSGAVVSVPSLNKFVEIEASPELKSNISVITIQINYSGSNLNGIDENSLRVYWWNESAAAWEVLADGGVDTLNKIVWGNVTHLSLFGIFESPKTLTVNPGGGANYTKIQDAIDNANAGDTIEVQSGTYHENVNVTKQLIMMGVDTGGGMPVVSAGGSGSAIKLAADGITLKGFIATGAGNVRGNAGISISSSNNEVSENIVMNNNRIGMLLTGSNNIVSNSTISGNVFGIILASPNNIVTSNDINNNNDTGLLINPANNNSGYSNTINNNRFNNTNNAGIFGDTISINTWNTTETAGTNILGGSYTGGNFWANPGGTGFSQTCADVNKDGICDSSFVLDSSNIDYLPLAFNIAPPASITNLTNITYNQTFINWTWTDPSDVDFSKVMIYLNGNFQNNVTNGVRYYNATGLTPSTTYEISTRTVDIASNINPTWVNRTATTAPLLVLRVHNINKGTNYITIQGAINDASPGDEIQVDSGTYYEHVEVTKSVSLIGAGAEVTIVNASDPNATVFLIAANYVNISGFTATGGWNGFSNSYGANNYANISNNNIHSNSYGIFLINSSGNTLKDNIVNSNSNYGIFLWSSSNYNALINNTASYNNGFGIDVGLSTGNNIIDNTLSNNNKHGIYLGTSNNNNLLNNIVASNNMRGIMLDNSNNNTLTNNNASLNNLAGIMLGNSSSYNILTNNSANFNGNIGIIIASFSSNNTLHSNIVDSNNYGIRMSSFSNNNTLIENIANSNHYYGIDVNLSSNDNSLIGNKILNNSKYGIYVNLSSNNTIYNNIFNNTNNFYNEDSGYNSWNTIKTSGANIIGGPYLGGNFWADPNGTGFSQTCTDTDRDGICDSPYVLDANNTDHLPLAAPNTSAPRTITVNASGGADYTRIQDAVNAASDEDTIAVAAGIYDENVVVNKSIILAGAGAGVTIVRAFDSNNNVFRVTVDNVNISGFTVTGATYSGILLEGAKHSNISNNIVLNSMRGIDLQPYWSGGYIYSDNNSLVGNIVSNNNVGINLSLSSNNTLRGNTVLNSSMGIDLYYISNNNTLINNTAVDNYVGIRIHDSSYNVLIDNVASNNTYGIENNGYFSINSSDNQIYNNIFNNTNNIYSDGTVYNYWNATKTLGTNIIGGSYLGGNFWANPNGTGFSQTCADVDNDGICDSPYILDANNTDYLPLASPAISAPRTITVNASGGADYTRIQDAIDNASVRDAILVQSGTYYENVNVNKQLILKGVDTGGGKPMVDAGGSSSAITLSAGYSTLDGFKAMNASSGYPEAGIKINSNNNIVKNNSASNNSYAISLDSSSNNTLSGNTASSNSNIGIFLASSSSNILTNNTASSNWLGIYLGYSNNNTLTNNTASSNSVGIRLASSSSNTLTNNTANSFSIGLYIESSSNNTLTNNTAKENGQYDVHVEANSDAQCNNVIQNTIGSGDRQIKYFNNSVNLQDEVLSELILCNANNSNINNVTISGSAAISNNLLHVLRTNNSNLTNIKSSNNFEGIILDWSSNNTLTNNTANSNNWDGIHLRSSSNNTLTNNIVSSNPYGIRLQSSSSNTLINNTADSSGQYGIYLQFSSTNTLSGNNASNNNEGIHLDSSNNNTIYNNYFNNTNNVVFTNTIYSNTWNTTKTPGTNIIGGYNLGGNFWANPNGTGFSQTCADADKDSICDSPYILDANNTDYLPLSMNFTFDTIPPANITGFGFAENDTGHPGGWIITSVNVTNTDVLANTYVVMVSGVSDGYQIAGTATMILAPEQSINNVPVLVLIPPTAPAGNFNLNASIWKLEDFPDSNKLIMTAGPITATVS